RHINDADARRLVEGVAGVTNFECAAREDVIDLACALRPTHATLVPERREELTTEGGLTLEGNDPHLRRALTRLAEAGIAVALFIDPDLHTIDRAADLGVTAV